MSPVDTESKHVVETVTKAATEPAKTRTFPLKKLAPLGVLVAGFVGFFAFGLDKYVTFEALHDNRMLLMDFVDQQGFAAIALFMTVYAVATALSLPGGAVLTITGGFLFGAIFGTIYVVIGATIGAIAVFLIAKTSVGDALRARAGPALLRMEEGFKENALNYLLVLRLIPLFPFFLVNIVPAFLGVPLRTYSIATFFGIIPGAFVFASVGAGIGSVFDQMGAKFDASAVPTTEVVVALGGLAILSLLPVAYKKFKGRRGRRDASA